MKESTWSPNKKREFRRVFDKVAYTAGAIFVKKQHMLLEHTPTCFVYIDLYSGDGGHPGGWGSPVIAIETLAAVYEKFALPYHIHLYEKETVDAKRLKIILGKALEHVPKGCSINLYVRDNDDVVNLQILDGAMGLVYADPYGGCEWAKVLLALSVDKKYEKIDMLVDLNPSSIKRNQGKNQKCTTCLIGTSLDNCINNIDKEFCKVREPDVGERHSIWQWALVFLSNNRTLFDTEWKKHRWYNMKDSPIRLQKLAKTNKELAGCG